MDSITKDPEEAKLAAIMFAGTDKWRKEVEDISADWYIESSDSLRLFDLFLKNNSHDYAILSHGLTSSHNGMLGRAEHFYRKG